MTDYTELQAELETKKAAGWQCTDGLSIDTVLALIAENEALSKRIFVNDVVYGPKAELRWNALSAERDELKAEVERLKSVGHEFCDELQAAGIERETLKAELAGLRTGYEAYESVKKGLKAEVEALKDEIATDDKLIADRDRLLNMFECPAHGQCIPYAMEQVEELRKDAERYRYIKSGDKGSIAIYPLTFCADWRKILFEEEADSAIDAAIGKGEQE